MFVPLHVKSDYSLGYGTASIEELVRRAAELRYRALALTDLENMYGQVRFHHECRMRGIHAVTGVELRAGFAGAHVPGARAGRVVLLAADDSGYRSLCRIVSLRRSGGDDGGADPVPVVLGHCEGLFALSDDLLVIERLLVQGFLPERLGFLVLRPVVPADGGGAAVSSGTPSSSQKAAASLGVRLVADLDAVFLAPPDHELHLLQLAVGGGLQMEEAARSAYAESRERWLRPQAEVAELFADLPEALHAASEIAFACTFQLVSERVTARHAVARGRQEEQELTRICRDALAVKRHPAPLKDLYARRLEEELSVFHKLGFSGFMLLVARILGHCKGEGIPVAARGSAVSSLVLHLLGASPVDPIAQGLLFERFLHEGKTAWPDVDIDLPWHRRDEVIDWVYRNFGEDRVAMVAAHHTFRYRSALREGLKAFAVPLAEIGAITRTIPEEEAGSEADEDIGGEGAAEEWDTWSAIERNAAPGIKRRLPLIRRLVGRPRHIAVHPGGVIIERGPLVDLLPLELAPKGVIVTQYDLVAVGRLGLVKIDLLGNRFLSEVEEALTLAGWPRPVQLADIPAGDQETVTLIDKAATVGCFQLESPAMRSLLARLPIRGQSDLVATLALIRPGAASGDVKDSFVRRARGEEPVHLAFPVLKDRLIDTYGLPIYEEDIMLLLSRTGRLTLAEADEMRRGIVKSGGSFAALTALQNEFLLMAQSRFHGDASALARARRAWTVAVRFAAYSFNKAHAASYALLAYYSAYLKAHYPLELACAILNHHQGLYPLRIEVSEFVRIGVLFLGAHVNRSGYHSELAQEEGGRGVRVGLDKVKGLSTRAAQALVLERDSRGGFGSLPDLLTRVRLSVGEIRGLVLGGACDGLAPLHAPDYPFPHEAAVELLDRKCDPAELEHLKYPKAVAEDEDERARLRLYQALVRVRNELTYLEMHLSAHPMELLRHEADRYGCVTIARVLEMPAEDTVAVAAVVAAMRRVPTRQGRLLFVTFEDETGLLEAILLPAVYRRIGEKVSTPGPFLVRGKVRVQQGAVHLEVSSLQPFHERQKAENWF